ncbi:hypothetical protein PR202_ga27107 [Eleusine coracana subsp. coracana]|uniref:Flap endonuclease GEN-like 1 n=1 Tax=Eleusine coracana subsp. coracana TaxID=191504 RepID=A0AAV5DFW7_ELECO|nr:hypothetical protein PR202_ga27107 [Eleusine coracana subsp. coracana]
MGVGGSFWDLLKPYARHEGAGYLRGRRVAVDLPFWIISHTTAIRARSPLARRPHLRATFFRTLSLFAKMGAYPVFVVDGEPSPLKSRARATRFGTDPSASPSTEAEAESSEAAAPVKGRSAAFTRHVEECVEMLQYLGMPILRANGEAEALCAQMNNEGLVDACITSDSDAFLFGAKTVIKVFRSNCKEPFECYHIADIESGLGLKRKQMVAMALLIGSDHDLHGVPGFGVGTAFRFVQLFDEDSILEKYLSYLLLYEIGRGIYPFIEGFDKTHIDDFPSPSVKSPIARSPHCSHCGHPGSKKNHFKAWNLKEQRRYKNWQIKAGKKIAAQTNFPNEEIIKLYLSGNNWNKDDDDDEEEATIAFESPELLDELDVPQVLTDDSCSVLLTDEDIHLVSAAFPMETKMFQQEQKNHCNILFTAPNVSSSLLQRLKEVKSRARKSKLKLPNSTFTKSYQIPPKHVHEKNLPNGTVKTPKGPRSSGFQLSIKDFYRSTKGLSVEFGKQTVGESSTTRTRSRKSPDTGLSENRLKSIRRCLHFD